MWTTKNLLYAFIVAVNIHKFCSYKNLHLTESNVGLEINWRYYILPHGNLILGVESNGFRFFCWTQVCKKLFPRSHQAILSFINIYLKLYCPLKLGLPTTDRLKLLTFISKYSAFHRSNRRHCWKLLSHKKATLQYEILNEERPNTKRYKQPMNIINMNKTGPVEYNDSNSLNIAVLRKNKRQWAYKLQRTKTSGDTNSCAKKLFGLGAKSRLGVGSR